MPVIKQQGLRGLRGLGELSDAERKRFFADNAAVLDKYRNNPMHYGMAAERLYENQKFINTFGEDAFDQLNDGTRASYDYRNQLFRAKIIDNAFVNRFKKDKDFSQIYPQLDTDAMYDLLTNEEYMGENERRRRYNANLNASRKVGKSYDAAINNPYIDAIGAGFMQWGKAASASNPSQKDADYKKRDKEILDRLFAETQQRRETEVQDTADIVYADMLNNDDSGRKSLAQYYKEFDKVASNNNYGYYAAFKNSKWLKDYTNEDKLKDYAKYLALKQKYGEAVASTYLQRTIQNRIADAQDGSWTGNTLKGVLTTTWSDLGSNVALFANIGKSTDEMAILNQGKDPSKPIYDKKGNIVDYARNDNWVTNPAYWNNVYKYNTFSPTEIKTIEERGGISEDVNVRSFGYTPDFLSWDTMEEGFKQGGHVLASLIETGLTGYAGKAIGWAGNGAMKLAGLSAKTMQSAAKAGSIANDIIVGATTGLEGSQLEAMGTFDEQMQLGKEKIQNQIRSELYDYQRSINYNSNEAKLNINNIYRQLKARDNQRVAMKSNREGTRAFPLSDETLKAQAKQLYTNQLLEAKQKELQELHRKDEMEVARAAQKAYAANFVMDYAKNIPLTLGIQKYKIAKGSMRSTFDNTVKKNIIEDVETGGVKRGYKVMEGKGEDAKEVIKDRRYSSGKRLGLEIAKQLGGGFMDEYLDGLNASFASGIGNNEFDNYIKRTYDPEAYNTTVDTILGNLFAGVSEGIDGITDRQNLYEGFIGMISPIATGSVNPAAAFRPKDTWKAVMKGTDPSGEKLGMIDRLRTIWMNPLLNVMAEANEKDKGIDNAISAINNVIAANKNKLQDISKVISVLNNYNGALNADNGLLDYKDNKLQNAFTLISVLNTLENIDGGTGSKLYKDTMKTMEGLANGTLSKKEREHEIDKFLADEDNKSFLDEIDKDSGSEEEKEKRKNRLVTQRLQANAKYFMDMKDKVAEVMGIFANSSKMKDASPEEVAFLAYNIVASDDYQKRLQSLEKELGLGNTDTESLFKPNYDLRYVTNASRNQAVIARDREIDRTQKEIDKNIDECNKLKDKIESLVKERSKTNDEDRYKTMKDLIQKKKRLLKAKEFERKNIEERKRILVREREEISKLADVPAMDEGTILNADVRDIAFMFDPKNKDNYTQGRQDIIDNVINNLSQKDPEALIKIHDAAILAQRIEDMRAVYNKVLNNDELAAEYFNTISAARDRTAMAESLQKDINTYYTQIDDAYANREKDPVAFKNFILNKSPELIEAYMQDHPKQAEALRPYYEMLEFDKKAGAVIAASGYTGEERKAMAETIATFNSQANNLKELENLIEGLIDSPDVEQATRDKYEHLMSEMSKLDYQRDSTILEKRNERKKREEEQRKKQEEAKQKEDKDVKAATEKGKETTETPIGNPNANAADLGRISNYIEGFSDPEDKPKEDETTESNAPSEETSKEDTTKDNTDTSSSDKEHKAKEGATKINYLQVMKVSPDEYESIPETAEHKENATFEAHSAEKDGDNWYFIGNFAGDQKETKVKSKKNLDKEADNNAQQNEEIVGSTVKEEIPSNLVIEGDEVKGRSASLEQQMQDSQEEGKKVQLSDSSEDADTLNSVTQQTNDTSEYSLGGNGMSRYESRALENDGRIVLRKGKEKGDNMDKFYAWMNAAGIKLQNIIDREVARIIRRNPHAKVKFMGVKPVNNATNDDDMFKHCMLVLDYDDNINKGITSIHDDANGGVIESNGKKYLVIGVAGYPKRNRYKQGLWNILWDSPTKDGLRLTVERKKFFDAHPNERFYVNEVYHTEVIPYSQIPGYIVRQKENDENPEFRSVRELLADKERNPMGYTMQSVSWGIQEMTKFLVVGNANISDVMVPRNTLHNLGSAFVLMPASNGKMVPSYLKVLKYTEMRDGALKDRVNNLLQEVVSPNYENGLKAIVELCKIFYFDPAGDDILRRKGRNEVSLVHDGEIQNTFVLDSNFDRTQFLKAFEDINPRVNITAQVLNSERLLKEYDEAGALMTDAALFGTAGSSYSIYALDKSGKMMMPMVAENPTKSTGDSDYRKEQTQIIYDHQYYREDDGTFSLDGKVVTDEKLIEQLQYNKRIIDNKLTPVMSDKTWEYYILSSGEHPEAIKVDRNTKEVKVSTEEQAKKLIEKLNEEKAKEQREKAAKTAVERSGKDDTINKVTDVNLKDSNDNGVTMDPETGEMIQENASKESSSKELSSMKEGKENKPIPSSNESKAPTQTFAELMGNRKYKLKVMQVLNNKWKDMPSTVPGKEKFLKDKNIEVDAIGTSKADIEAWIKTIEDCR